jgi:prevent-host-death family protein
LLSDGAFKLYMHLCLTADRSSGQVQADHADLAKALGKSRRSVVVYLEELRRQGVCKTQPARNQHGQGQIKVCEAFWPYERPPAQETPRSLADYTAHIRRLLAGRACVKVSFSPADEKLAAAFFERHVPMEIVEHGILMACTRKYMALLTTPNKRAMTWRRAMIDLREVRSVTEFQRNLKDYVGRLKEKKTPMVLTVNGRAEVVVQDADSYQALLDRLERAETIAAHPPRHGTVRTPPRNPTQTGGAAPPEATWLFALRFHRGLSVTWTKSRGRSRGEAASSKPKSGSMASSPPFDFARRLAQPMSGRR